MELELGLKITRARDGSSSSFQFSKQHGRCCFTFVSRETETMFILIGNLPGFRKGQVWIEINELGTEITINGCCAKETMMIMNWIPTWTKGPKIRQFKKIFRIPDGVILDGIVAKFNEEDGVMSIFMPKSKKGVLQGTQIEEVKDEEHPIGPDDTQENPESGNVKEENRASQQEDAGTAHGRKEEQVQEYLGSTELSKHEGDIQAPREDVIGDKEQVSNQEMELPKTEVGTLQGLEDPPDNDWESQVHQRGGESGEDDNAPGLPETAIGGGEGRRGRTSEPCLWVSSAMLMALIVLVFQLLRGKKKHH